MVLGNRLIDIRLFWTCQIVKIAIRFSTNPLYICQYAISSYIALQQHPLHICHMRLMETGNGVINWSGLHGKTANHSPYLRVHYCNTQATVRGPGVHKLMFYYLKARYCVIQCTMYVPMYFGLWVANTHYLYSQNSNKG